MKNSCYKKILVLGVIVIFFGANVVSSMSVKKSNNPSIYINSDEGTLKNYNNKDDDGRVHFYFFVDFTITVHAGIFCSYPMFDIQGREFVPFFNAIRLSSSYNDPVVDITIRRISGKTLYFTLSNIVFIFASIKHFFRYRVFNP